MTALADLSTLARPARVDVKDVIDAVFGTIRHAIANQPRSLQKALGPSELGQACERRLFYKMAQAVEVNARSVPWRPFVGTAVHAKLEEVFTVANAGQPVQWLTEKRVNVGELFIRGELVPVVGSSDLMALAGGTVIDWKCIGPTSLRKYRKQGPGPQYRAQAHLYGRGFVRRGLPVDDVCIIFLPSNDELDDAVIWHEPYDEQIALDTLARAQRIQTLADTAGLPAVAGLPTTDDNCATCPFYAPGSTDLTRGCPGDPEAAKPAPAREPAFAGLI